MWVVRLALRCPYTFVVVSLLILLLGIGTSVEAPKDIYPHINISVVTVVWSYSGLSPEEMEGRIVTLCERALTTTVNDIEHTQSESYVPRSPCARNIDIVCLQSGTSVLFRHLTFTGMPTVERERRRIC